MALPDFAKREVGTAKTWKASGGDYGLTMTSLANGAERQGAKGDLGANRAPMYAVLFSSSVAVAATDGSEIELYWAASPHATAGTDNPGNTDGTDAALTNGEELKRQLIFVGSLVLSNARGTNIQKQMFVFCPPMRYGMPVTCNTSGQALGATAADHEVRLIPIEEAIEDTI
jgi:hypothetical protein